MNKSYDTTKRCTHWKVTHLGQTYSNICLSCARARPRHLIEFSNVDRGGFYVELCISKFLGLYIPIAKKNSFARFATRIARFYASPIIAKMDIIEG